MANDITETIGLDLGDRYTHYSVLDQESGEEVGSGRVRTTPSGMERFLVNYPRARVVLEVGAHSRWANQVAVETCAEVLVANPRKLSFIYKNNRKSDVVDALSLARVGRLDPSLLSPIRHRSRTSIRSPRILFDVRASLVRRAHSSRGLRVLTPCRRSD